MRVLRMLPQALERYIHLFICLAPGWILERCDLDEGWEWAIITRSCNQIYQLQMLQTRRRNLTLDADHMSCIAIQIYPSGFTKIGHKPFRVTSKNHNWSYLEENNKKAWFIAKEKVKLTPYED